MKIFCQVVRHLSVSRAAVNLGITQPAVSQRISQIEKKLGFQLLDRSVRTLRLAVAGRAFHSGCIELLERYRRLDQTVSQVTQLQGQVAVAAIYSAGIDLLNHIKQRMVELHPHPQVEVTIDHTPPARVYELVRRRRCDLGIVSYPPALA